MLTKEQVKEIVKTHVKPDTDIRMRDGVLQTRQNGDKTWTRHGRVADPDEARASVDEALAEMGDQRINSSDLEQAFGPNVKVVTINVDDADIDTVKAIGQLMAGAMVDDAVKTMMESKALNSMPPDIDPETTAKIMEGSKATGIPPVLMFMAADAVDTSDDGCNCGRCLAERMLERVGDNPLESTTSLLKFAAMSKLLSQRGPQPGSECHAPEGSTKMGRVNMVMDAITRMHDDAASYKPKPKTRKSASASASASKSDVNPGPAVNKLLAFLKGPGGVQ